MIEKPNILVIGDLMLDSYLWGNCTRISPEAPVQIVNIDKETSNLGGAGNVINNLKSLDAKVSAISVVGKDKSSKELELLLQDKCIDYLLLKEKKRSTSKKTRIIATHSQVIRFDKENIEKISKKSQNKILLKVQDIIKDMDILILSDYNKGILTKSLTKKIIKISNKHNVKVIADPKGRDFNKYKNTYLLTPNKKEAQEIIGKDLNTKKDFQKLFDYFKEKLNIKVPLVTLSQNGVSYLENNAIVNKPTYAKEVFDVTGAGDTIVATLSYFIAKGFSLSDSIEYANKAAGIVVGKIGCATVSLNEVLSSEDDEYEGKLKSKIELKTIVAQAKKDNRKVVFTNGCFDILHKGHISYLKEAKKLGDILIIALNSNSSIKKLKGENRPINSIEDRIYMLSAYSFVDFITVFDENTPYDLIKTLSPNILVKGEDYKDKKVVGANLVDELKLIKFIKGKSTSSIIDKLKR